MDFLNFAADTVTELRASKLLYDSKLRMPISFIR